MTLERISGLFCILVMLLVFFSMLYVIGFSDKLVKIIEKSIINDYSHQILLSIFIDNYRLSTLSSEHAGKIFLRFLLALIPGFQYSS